MGLVVVIQVIGQVAFYDYIAVSFRRQVVAGANYIIKVICCYSNVMERAHVHVNVSIGTG